MNLSPVAVKIRRDNRLSINHQDLSTQHVIVIEKSKKKHLPDQEL